MNTLLQAHRHVQSRIMIALVNIGFIFFKYVFVDPYAPSCLCCLGRVLLCVGIVFCLGCFARFIVICLIRIVDGCDAWIF